MLNYMKSEFYRITHSAAIYVAAFVFAGLPLGLNLILYALKVGIPDYRYATTSFSFSNLVANPMLFCYAALIIVFILYEGNKKNGNLKNVIAFGISREKVLMGQLAVSFVSCVVILIITEAVYLASAVLLLRNEGVTTAMDMLREIGAVLPLSVAALILSLAVVQLFEKSITGLIVWLCILSFVPKVFFYISMEVEVLREPAMWLPEIFFSLMQVNQSICAPIWNTPEGLARCLTAGFAGIVIFGIFGLFSYRKKEF